MADTGWKNPSATGEDYNQWWGAPANAYTSNDAWAVSDPSDQQDYYNFTFDVPVGATIVGIEVSIEAKRMGYGANFMHLDVELSWDSGPNYTATGKRNTWTEEHDVIRTYGGAADLWGRVWTQPEFSNANFRLWCENDATSEDSHGVDHIKVKVYYTIGVEAPSLDLNNKSLAEVLRVIKDSDSNIDCNPAGRTVAETVQCIARAIGVNITGLSVAEVIRKFNDYYR